jgi:inner membrane protein
VTVHGRTALAQRAAGAIRRALRLTPASLTVAALGLAAADLAYRSVGDSVFPGGALDEVCHLLTTLLVLWALGPRVRRFMVPALVASVLIDTDHVPAQFGVYWLTEGTPRPYTHSLLSIAVVLIVAVLWPRRRDVALGVAIGLALHFWRDMAEGGAGVSLLWPVSRHAFQYPHAYYLALMAVVVAVDAGRLLTRDRRRSSRLRDVPIPTRSPP